MKKSAVILILMAFLCQNIAWGREFTLRPPLQGSLSKRTREVLSIPGFLLTGKIKLTKKQKAVLDLTAKGWRGGNIATALSIAEKTVGVHHNNIRNGLNLKGKGIDTRGAFLYHIYQNGYIISQPPNELVTKIIDLANELSPAEQKVLESAMSGKGSIKDIVAYLNKSKGTVVIQISHINRSFEDITNKNEFSDWEIDFWLAAAILFVNLEAYNEAKKTREVLNIPKIKLTASQKTVLDLTAKGWKEGDIAAELSIRNKTVNVHRDNIRNGLNLKGKGIDTRGAFLYHIYQNGYIISQPPNELVTKIIDLANELSPAEQKVLESAMSGKSSIKAIALDLNRSVVGNIVDMSHFFRNTVNEKEFSDWKVDFWLAAAILSVNLEVYNEAKEAAERLKIIIPIRSSL